MTRTNKPSRLLTIGVALAGLVLCFAGSGCEDEWTAAGDFWEPTVAPMDFSPYGYDYSFYDVLTDD